MAEDVRNVGSTKGIKEFEGVYESPHCVVLDSAYCSMGRMIGYKACELSGFAYYDAAVLLELVPEYGLTKDDVDVYEQKLRRDDITAQELKNDPEFAKLTEIFDKAVDIALSKGPCLIHDRIAKEEVIAKGYTCVSAMTYATDLKAKIVKARVSVLYKDTEKDEDVIRGIHEEDNIRINWHKAHSDTQWGDLKTYDIALNTDVFGRDYSAQLLAKIMKAE
jgi:hypothetical protein